MSTSTHQLAATCLPFWNASFIVHGGSVYRKAKNGVRTGKPLPPGMLIGPIAEACPVFHGSDVSLQIDTVKHLISLANEHSALTGGAPVDDEDGVIDEVDPWFVGMLMPFRWRSNGSMVRGFYQRALAKAITEGQDPDTADVVREVQPLQIENEHALAMALMKEPLIWAAYEDAYKRAISDPQIRVSPRAVREGVKYYHTFRNYLKVMMPAWLSDIRFNIAEEPSTIANSPKKWAYWHFGPHSDHRFDPDAECKPTPTWDGWLAKLGHPDRIRAFRAWLFSVCVAKNRGRQLMWLEGQGGDGKGAVAGAIMSFLGERGAFPFDDSIIADSHGSAAIYGYRLLVHPDCKNARLLSYGLVHRITGGDPIYMNPKFGTPYQERTNARILVLANCPPAMDVYNKHERSRMLYFYLSPNAKGADRSHLRTTGTGVQLVGDITFEKRLLAEMPDMLLKAMTDYQDLCPTDGNIILPDTVAHDVEDRCASTEQERFEVIYDENFEHDDGAWLESKTLKELFDRLMTGGSKGEYSYASFVKFIEAKGHRKIRPGKGNSRPRGFRYLKAKGTDGLRLADYELREHHIGIDDEKE